jgi:hypothetical protein
MPDAQISPAAPAPAVVVNSRDTRIMGVHPQQGHTTNGKGVQIHGDQTVRSTMGASGARVAAPNGLPQGTPKAQTGAAISKPAPTPTSVTKAATAKADGVLTSAEAALCLDIVEGQVAQVVIASLQTSPMLELAKDVVKKLRVQAGVPATVPLPWDLAPAAIAAAPVPVPIPVPDPAAAPVLSESSQGPASPDRAAAAGGGAQVNVATATK